MLEVDDSQAPERREGHERWLVMQSAYAEYQRASEACGSTVQFADDSIPSARIRLTMLDGKQRAFERYLEARMEFLEFQFDGSKLPPAAPSERDTEASKVSSWSVFANYMPVLQMLGVILLCTTAFSLVREQKHLRDLEAIRSQRWATLSQPRDGVALYGHRLDIGLAPQQAAIRDVGQTPLGPALRKPTTTPQATARRGQPAQRVQPKQAGAKPEPAKKTQSRRIGTPNYYRFSLSPSRRFELVGPIKVSLLPVDSRRKSVGLSIHSNSMQMDVTHLQLNQPMWINVGYSEQPLELVVDRIDGNRLDGHLLEPTNHNGELRASQFRSTLPARP